MSALFGGQDDVVIGPGDQAAGVRIQSSTLGYPIALIFGRNRVAPNIIWSGNFQAEMLETSSGGSGGKGGGGSKGGDTKQQSWLYSIACAFALGYGVISAIQRIWIGKQVQTGLGSYELFTGSTTQAPWPWLLSFLPAEALNYRRLAYVAISKLNLGSQPNMLNHTMEVDGLERNLTGFGTQDCDTKDVTVRLLTDAFFGAGFPSANIGNLTDWSNYSRASGIVVSPVYTSRMSAAERILRLATITNTGLYFSEGLLKARPFADESATGNGATYTPDNTPIYDLTDEDFENKDEPVLCLRSNPADAYNRTAVKFFNRASDYAEDEAEAKDQALIDVHGLRTMEAMDYTVEIVDRNVARLMAQHVLQRVLYIRNTYKFTLPLSYMLLEPTDLVTVTDTALGLDKQLCRVLSIEEDDAGRLAFEVEEVPTNVSAPATYGSQQQAGFSQNYNVAPGNTTAVVLDAPGILALTGFELWVAAAGGVDWGGCNIYVSLDNATYQMVGTLQAPSRFGKVHTSTFPSGSDPDTVNTCKVDLTNSRATLLGGTQAQADQFSNLGWLSTSKELISYTTATLTAQYKYDLTTYIRRGAYNTAIAAHPVADDFVRMDEYLFKYPYPPDLVGKTIYFKFQSFNRFGAAVQSLAALTPVSFVIGGPIGAPNVPTGFTVQQFGAFINFSVDKVPNVYLDRVEIRFADPGELDWNNGIPVVNILRGNTDTNGTVPPGTWRFMARAFDRAGIPSKTWAIFDFTVTAETFVTIITQETFPSWLNRQKENWFTRSEDQSHANWSTDGLASRTANSAVDWFNALSLTKMVENTANSVHELFQSVSGLSDNADVCMQATLLKGTRTWAILRGSTKAGAVKIAYFNLDTGVVGTVGSGVTARISKPSRSGAYLCSISFNVGTGGSTPFFAVGQTTGDNVSTYTGDGTSFIYTGNAQVVTGVIPREYHPTAATNDVGPHGNLNVSVSYALALDTGNVATDLSDAELWDQYAFGAYSLCTYQQPEMDKLLDARVRVWADIVSVLGPAEITGTANPQHQVDYKIAAGAYDGFENWTIGTAIFRYLKSRLQFSPANGKIKITAFKTAFDAEPHIEESSFTTPAGGSLAVSFTTAFHLIPALQVTPQGSGDVSASYTDLTRLGFTGYHKTAGAASAGSVAYQARGA